MSHENQSTSNWNWKDFQQYNNAEISPDDKGFIKY